LFPEKIKTALGDIRFLEINKIEDDNDIKRYFKL